MKKNKITLSRSILLISGVLSTILTAVLLSADSYELLSSSSEQNYKVSPLLYLSYIMLFLNILAVIYFNVGFLRANRAKLRQISIISGVVLFVFLVCYFLSSGNEFLDRNKASDFMAQLIEAGLMMLYLLLSVAAILIFIPINRFKKY